MILVIGRRRGPSPFPSFVPQVMRHPVTRRAMFEPSVAWLS